MGAVWVGPSNAVPPVKLWCSILFAPAEELIPTALQALDKGGTLAFDGVYMTPIPSMDFEQNLFAERNLRNVTANTRWVDNNF
jgi:propanol-preferring alcohol dehydrogenase